MNCSVAAMNKGRNIQIYQIWVNRIHQLWTGHTVNPKDQASRNYYVMKINAEVCHYNPSISCASKSSSFPSIPLLRFSTEQSILIFFFFSREKCIMVIWCSLNLLDDALSNQRLRERYESGIGHQPRTPFLFISHKLN